MTPEQYKKHRRRRGTPQDLAPLLGVAVSTIHRRENGGIPITKEAEIVLLSLPRLRRPVPEHTLGRKPGSKSKHRQKKILCKSSGQAFNKA